MAFPNFHGRRGENAGNFLDDLEMAFLVSRREDEEIKLRAFPLVLREEAKVWFQDLDMGKQGNWEALKRAFLLRYSGDNNPEEIWRKLSKLQQASPDSYSEYEIQFLKLWTQWENSLPEGERTPNFLQKERFLAGLTPILREKVKSSRVTTQEQAHPLSPNGSEDPHLDRLRRVTKQLDSLSINLIHGLQPKQPVQQQVGGQGTNDEVPRRLPRREYQCHSYGEDEHGMYFCPYPRGYGNASPRGPQQQVSPLRMRPPPMPMCEQQQQPQQHQPIQILRQSIYAPVPQPTTEVPPLPHDGVERAMNVISCEDIGEEKIMKAEAMPGKQARVAEEPRQMTTNDGANKKEKKRNKRANMTRRKIGIINFPVKSKPHDLIEEVQRQEHKLTWPQLLHLSPRMRRQWSKMVSTRRSKSVNTLKAQVLEDDVPVLDTQIKGQRVSSDYVDGGAQMYVISEKRMHKLGLEVSGPSGFKGNDVSVKYVGVVIVCGIQFGVDMYVLPARGEGYPIILGRPWLIAMNARQDWKSRTLLLKPPRKEGKSIQTIVYNVKEGRKESSELETSEDEWSTEDSSSTAEVMSSVSDSESEKASLFEAMGVVLTRPTTQDGGSIKETLSDEKIEDMLSTDLSKEERKEFEVMLQKHSPLFILDYKQIKGVTMHKDEVLKVFKTFLQLVENQSVQKMKCLRTDNGGEYVSKAFQDFCEAKRIKQELIAPYSCSQKGIAERMNRTIQAKVRSMSSNTESPDGFWAKVVSTAVYLINKSLSRVLEREQVVEMLWTRKDSSYNNLRIFGCEAYSHIPKEFRNKLEPKSRKCIYLGYGESGEISYRLWDPESRKVLCSNDVYFNEAKFHAKLEKIEEIRRLMFREDGTSSSTSKQHGQAQEQPTVAREAESIVSPLQDVDDDVAADDDDDDDDADVADDDDAEE
ncbi:hypothetical protein L7F22_027812 [Adiantum nelumboides]|nr:hypothetical protein [Adiantum nelumboides]